MTVTTQKPITMATLITRLNTMMANEDQLVRPTTDHEREMFGAAYLLVVCNAGGTEIAKQGVDPVQVARQLRLLPPGEYVVEF